MKYKSLAISIILIIAWIVYSVISDSDPNRVSELKWTFSDFVFPCLILFFIYGLQSLRKENRGSRRFSGWPRVIVVLLASSGIGFVIAFAGIMVSYLFLDSNFASALFDNFIILFLIGFVVGFPISLRYAKW